MIPLPRGLIAALCLAFVGTALAQPIDVPALRAHVTDTNATLTAAEAGALEQKLTVLEQQKGSQLAVLIVASTGEETIEQYGIRVAEAWKLGRKGVDDGAILLVATGDRKLRIEVGYGLEGALPDAIAKRIVAEVITPYFKRGDYYTGISAGVDAMAAVVAGEPLPEPTRKRSGGKASAADAVGLAALAAGIVVGFFVRAATNRVAGGVSALIVAGVVAAIFVGVAVALFYALFAFFLVSGGGGRGRGGRGGAFLGGAIGGFGGGGFGGGGGGFSGGGGGFGGGGASGDW